jgi:aspartyl-tRNA(Asn)/glutamyl-tRNA(Gln) amidotransferase subunit A
VSEQLRTSLADLPLLDVDAKIAAKELSPVEVTTAALDRLTAVEPELNAFVTVLADSAMAQAQMAEAEILRGDYRGPLHGIPVSAKDLFNTRGVRTSAGSRVLAEHVPDEDATVVTRLNEAGAILIGKNNMLEFAYAAVHPDYGPTKNPWALDRSTSGSSSGSGAAVAAGVGFGSLGSDTGGSIRLPAAFCGIVGLKPTYGRVSRSGGVALSWSCDHMGPMTRTVADNAAMLTAIAGADPKDSTTGNVPVPDYLAALRTDLTGVRVGLSSAYRTPAEPSVQAAVEEAIAELQRLGATIVEIELPPPSEAVPALIGLITSEATEFHLPWLRTRPEDYSPAVRERLELGLLIPATDYLHAQRVRRQLIDRALPAFADVDVVVMPTSPTAATPLGGDLSACDEADPELLAAAINFTGPFDLLGFPALSIPCGFTPGGLPVGLQLVAAPYDEAKLYSVAHAYEQATKWIDRMPTALGDLLRN